MKVLSLIMVALAALGASACPGRPSQSAATKPGAEVKERSPVILITIDTPVSYTHLTLPTKRIV